VDIKFSSSVLDVVSFDTFSPIGIKLVNFTCNFFKFFKIIGFVYFAKTSFSKKGEKLVFFTEYRPGWLICFWIWSTIAAMVFLVLFFIKLIIF